MFCGASSGSGICRSIGISDERLHDLHGSLAETEVDQAAVKDVLPQHLLDHWLRDLLAGFRGERRWRGAEPERMVKLGDDRAVRGVAEDDPLAPLGLERRATPDRRCDAPPPKVLHRANTGCLGPGPIVRHRHARLNQDAADRLVREFGGGGKTGWSAADDDNWCSPATSIRYWRTC